MSLCGLAIVPSEESFQQEKQEGLGTHLHSQPPLYSPACSAVHYGLSIM